MSKVFRPSLRSELVHTLGLSSKVFKAVLLGPPGSNKWELGERLAKNFKFLHIPVRERINKNIEKDSKFGQLAKTCIEKGVLIPNKITLQFITKDILEAELAGKSWLISGFPVTETQASLFWSHTKLHMAIQVSFPEDIMVQNLIKRNEHGKTPEGGLVEAQLAGISKLIENYNQISKPMFKFYKDHNVLHSFYSNNIDAIWEKISKSVDNHVTVFNDEDVR